MVCIVLVFVYTNQILLFIPKVGVIGTRQRGPKIQRNEAIGRFFFR